MKKNNKKYGIISIIDNLVWAAIGALFVVIGYMDTSKNTKIIYAVILAVFACIYMWFIYVKATKDLIVATPVEMIRENNTHIRKLILLNDEYQMLKQWNIEGKAGLLIGKNTKEETVDIDLSDTALSALISNEHALLNYTNGNWFVEDFDSEQGTAVQKVNKSELQYLTKSEPVQLEAGDYIYIGKTILQVK
ncbi:MAG: FHA domain-containing protein [Clostridiales bacterium]|nr:FHA domain-containing protein [Clostridiales bacterium]